MTNLHYNPLFLHALTGTLLEDIPAFPPISELPGEYSSVISKELDRFSPPFKKNVRALICGNCKKQDAYDIGQVSVLIESLAELDTDNLMDTLQMTGYFRCTFCNSAGNWLPTDSFKMHLVGQAWILFENPALTVETPYLSLMKKQLFDGTVHPYATDLEEHFLKRILADKRNTWLWYLLGAAYYSGGRADLAAASFEYVLSIDSLNTKCLSALDKIVIEIDKKKGRELLLKAVATAPVSDNITAINLKETIAECLLLLFNSSEGSNLQIGPPRELYEELGIEPPFSVDTPTEKFEFQQDDITSFYPLALKYMGKRVAELPKKPRSYVPNRKKKKPKKRKK